MNVKRFHRPDASKFLGAATLGVALFALSQRASAQYSADFSNPPFAPQQTVSDTDGWTSNDEYTGATYTDSTGATLSIGQADVVDPVNGYSTSQADNLAIIGGFLNQDGGALPGASTEYLSHATALPADATSFNFGVDFIVTQTGASFQTAHDTFGFYVGNPTNASTSGFSINFEPTGRATGTTPSTTADNVSVTSNGVLSQPLYSITLGSRYRLSITGTYAANATGTFTAQILQENNMGGIAANTAAVTLTSGQAFSGSISQISALWKLADTLDRASATTVGPNPSGGDDTNTTAFTGGGANNLYFDNLATSVPEPSTYAFLSVGVLGLLAMVRSRRSQHA